jgi:hypothetical protein
MVTGTVLQDGLCDKARGVIFAVRQRLVYTGHVRQNVIGLTITGFAGGTIVPIVKLDPLAHIKSISIKAIC